MTNSNSRPSQQQMFYSAGERQARMNDTFVVLVKSGMTRRELKACIEKRPSLWSRYANWLQKLPEQRPEQLRAPKQVER